MGELVERNFQGAFVVSACSFFFADSFRNYSQILRQIVDHVNVCPEAMKVVDALIRSAQELLFDASSDVDVVEVINVSILQNNISFFFAASPNFCFQSISR